MLSVERLTLLYKVASLYYEQGWKKYDIASEIKQSPTQVGLLLKEAIEKQIVTINVNLPWFSVLRDHLIKKFGLFDAVVVPSDKDVTSLLRNLSRATAQYFEENVSDGKKVSVGSGYLTYRMIDELEDRIRDIDIYPTAVIGRGPTINHIDPIALVTLLWAKSGQQRGREHYVTLTPPEHNATEQEVRNHYKALKENVKLKELMSQIKEVDFIFTSIGSLNADKDYMDATNKNTQNLLDELKLTKNALRQNGAIGDIAYSFFDAKGNTKPEWQIFPSVGIKHLKKMAISESKRVVVTVGRYKIDSLRAVLNGKLCNVLITDAEAAGMLLK